MNPGSASLLELLALDPEAQFVIPAWRRQYVWDATERVERLWQDLRSKCDGGRKHFCGVILLHKLDKESVATWEIIDGQQRLATLLLLLMALRDVCEKRGVNCTDSNNLIRAGNSNACRLALQDAPSTDRRVLHTLFNREGLGLEQKIQDESKVCQAYRYLLGRIENEVPSESQKFLAGILQEVEFRVQLVDPTEQTRRAFETLDAQGKQPDAGGAVSGAAQKEPVVRSPLKTAGGNSFRFSQKMGFGVIGLLFIAILFVLMFLWRDSKLTKIVYYREITQGFGIPQGMGKLSTEQDLHRSVSYQVESAQGKNRRITELNGSGHPVDDPALYRASTEEIQYAKNEHSRNENLTQIVFFNHNGREVLREIYRAVPGAPSGTNRQDIEFKFLGRKPSLYPTRNFSLLSEEVYSNDMDGKSSVVGEIVDYTPEGRASHIQFRNSAGQPRSNSKGVFARNLEYNAAGQAVKISNLGPDGKPMADKQGVAALTRTFDALGNQIDEISLDLKGQPVLNPSGYARVVFKYDDHGNKIEVTYFDAEGKPTFHKGGFARLTAKYDEHGNLVEQSCWGVKADPVVNTDGFTTEALKYDANGNVIEADYSGIDGKPLLTKEGYATEKFTHDERGNIIERTYFDVDGKPMLNQNGFASESSRYDARDNVIETTGLGVDGHPVLGNNGYARVTFKYNDRNDKIEAAYFDAAGQPVLNNRGIARETFAYDENDNIIEQSYFGIDGQLALNKDGAAKLTAKYDERGNVLETACFDLTGQPALDKNGVAREAYKYDGFDNVLETGCFGVDGRPVLDRGGVARAIFKYDARGNKLDVQYFDADGNPTLNRGGFNRETFKYDARDNTIEGAFFNLGGQPTLGPNGFARETLKYDDRDRIIEAACFGIEGQPIEIGGAHQIVYTYDSAGKISKTERFDRDGQPVL